jgi:hypothetical protein
MTRGVSFRYSEPVNSTPPPSPTAACQAHDNIIDNQDGPFDVMPFCGSGTDRYGAVIDVDLCCEQSPCSTACSLSQLIWLVRLTAFDDDDNVVLTSTDYCFTPADMLHFRIDLGCQFDSESLPVRWRAEMGSASGLRPWRMTVHYICCYGGSCGPTATP